MFRNQPKNQKYLFLIDGEKDFSYVESKVKQLSKRGNRSLKVISFFFPTKVAFALNPRFSYWRELLSPDEEISIFQEAYDLVDLKLSCLPENFRESLMPYYSTIAQRVFQIRALEFFLQREKGPVIFLCYRFPAQLDEWRELGVQILAEEYEEPIKKRRSLQAREKLQEILVKMNRRFRRIFGPFLRPFVNQVRFKFKKLERNESKPAEYTDLLEDTKSKVAPASLEREIKSFEFQADQFRAGAESLSVLVVDDSGTGVNVSPASSVLLMAKEMNQRVVGLTTTEGTLKGLLDAGNEAYLIPIELKEDQKKLVQDSYFSFLDFLDQDSENWEGVTSAHFLKTTLKSFFLESALFEKRVYSVLDDIEKIQPVLSVCCLNEAVALSVAAANWSKKRKTVSVGYLPILIFSHPETKYFPAERHLVYGEQAKELYIQAGYSSDSIQAVGSTIYDKTVQKPQDVDKGEILDLLPKWRPHQKLIVIGTEARSEQMKEIEPITRILSESSDFHVVIKLHPDDSEPFFQNFVNGLKTSASVSLVNRCDLDLLLSVADLLICVRSNIMITAARLGTPSLVCDFSGEKGPVDFVEEGLCLGCKDPSEVFETVKALLFDKETQLKAQKLMISGLKRFNGPNDGRSAERVVKVLSAPQQF